MSLNEPLLLSSDSSHGLPIITATSSSSRRISNSSDDITEPGSVEHIARERGESITVAEGHQEQKESSPPSASSPSHSLERHQGLYQLRAMLYKQLLLKRRHRIPLCLEIITPILLCVLVVFGWVLSLPHIYHVGNAVYANDTTLVDAMHEIIRDHVYPMPIPPDANIIHPYSHGGDGKWESQYIKHDPIDTSSHPHPFITMAKNMIPSWIRRSYDDLPKSRSTSTSTSTSSVATFFPKAQDDPPEPTPRVPPANSTCYPVPYVPYQQLCFQGEDLKGLVNTLVSYNGPALVPRFDEYYLLHLLIRFYFDNVTDPDTSRQQLLMLNQRTDYLLGNLINTGKLAFVPSSPQVTRLVQYLSYQHRYFNASLFTQFKTEQEAVNQAVSNGQLWAVVIFHHLDIDGGIIDYTIRMNYNYLPSTASIMTKFALGFDETYKRYYWSGFLTIQNLIDSAILNISSTTGNWSRNVYHASLDNNNDNYNNNNNVINPYDITNSDLIGLPFPVQEYTGNRFYTTVGPVMGLILCMSLVYPISRLIKGIVEEKETKTKETMKMMGLFDWVYVCSWVLTAFLQFVPIAIIQAIILHATLLQRTDFGLLLCFLILSAISQIALSLLVTVFFSKAKLAAIAGPIVLFAMAMPRYAFFASDPSEHVQSKMFVSLCSPTAFTFGMDLIMSYEGANMGLSWSKLYEDAFSFNAVLMLLLGDTAIYALLAWYLENVLPNEYGSRRPWYFLCRRSYWSFHDEITSEIQDHIKQAQTESEQQQSADFEPIEQSIKGKANVVIHNLKKVYVKGSEKNVAVDDLNLNLYEGQITALLGHNGAGKTTTISVLTGLISPTSGDCYINGASVRHQMPIIRKSLGICPQHNVLFDRLTVQEHLRLYATLKGVPRHLIDSEVTAKIEDVGLTAKRHELSHALSGGMQRKLCVAMALIGDSKVVFLDEPTSGMDPYSRRSTWELLRKSKAGRVIVLTTHYMDEADLLGDRIAIMASGQVRCCGSSLFLKARFGIGYSLTLVKANKKCNTQKVTEMVKKYVTKASVLSSSGGEMAYRLPLESSHLFADLFLHLEKNRRRMGIGGYGISMTTMEEVFLRISAASNSDMRLRGASNSDLPQFQPHSTRSGEIEAVQLAIAPEQKENRSMSMSMSRHRDEGDTALPVHKTSLFGDVSRSSSVSSADSFLTEATTTLLPSADLPPHPRGPSHSDHLIELLRKRWICAKRDLTGRFFEILFPVLLVAFTLGILKLNGHDPSGPAIEFDASMYGVSHVNSHGATVRTSELPITMHTMSANEPGTLQYINAMRHTVLDVIHCNVTDSVKMSEYLLETGHDVGGIGGYRYSAVLLNDTLYDNIEWNNTSIPKSLLFPPTTIMHNSTFFHAIPVMATELTRARYHANRVRHHKDNSTTPTSIYRTSNYPLPLSTRETTRIRTFLLNFASFFMLIPFGFLPANFALFVVKERSSKAKHIQLVSGVNPAIYWISTFIWDFCNYLLIVFFVMMVFIGFGTSEYVGSSANAFSTLLLFVSYGLSTIPLCYVLSFIFTNHTSAQVGIAGVHFLFGFILLFASYMFDNIAPSIHETNAQLKDVYRWLPPYNLGEGLTNLAMKDFRYIGVSPQPSNLKWEIIGCNIFYMLLEFIVYFTLTLILEYNIISSLKQRLLDHYYPAHDVATGAEIQQEDDQDVIHERAKIDRTAIITPRTSLTPNQALGASPNTINRVNNRVNEMTALDENPDETDTTLATSDRIDDAYINMSTHHNLPTQTTTSRRMTAVSDAEPPEGPDYDVDDCVVRLQHLRKVYRPKGKASADRSRLVAVSDLCLGIPRGECFGFLGINGAGKTTTLKMLTGDETPTSGSAYINGYSLKRQMPEARRELGYCPQFDPLLDLMTAREHLYMFGRFRGLLADTLTHYVETLLQKLALTKHADRPAGTYSGGNKRKLSLAIALIGDPAVVLLDEPSCGMDPVSRRFMWTFIAQAAENRSCILTTHSMEECEALCTRIGIMVAGRLRCLGSIQHLKSKFGGGYHLEINVDELHLETCKQFVLLHFPGAELEEFHGGRLKYRLPKKNLSLSAIFREIEQHKVQLCIRDYAVSQATLEQIFIQISRAASV